MKRTLMKGIALISLMAAAALPASAETLRVAILSLWGTTFLKT